MKILTNNHKRPLLSWSDLTTKEQKELGSIESSYFRYKRQVWCTDDFLKTDSTPTWHGACGQSYFSAVLVRICDDGESVVVGQMYS